MGATITLIPGDGIGPSIVEATIQVLEAAGAALEYDRQLAGMAAVHDSADPLPPATLESVERTGLILKGPLTTPVGVGFRSINVALRREFDLYAAVRPMVTLMPGGRYEDIDLVLIRENTEGLYVGVEHYIGHRMAMFEPVHGSAPDIEGQSIANPTAQILAACMLLDHVGQGDVASRIRTCLRECDTLTRDLGGTASTDEYVPSLIGRLA